MAPDRQRHTERRKGGRKKGSAMKKLSNESQKGVPLYVCTSLSPLYHRPSYPQGKAIHPCPLLLTRRHYARTLENKKIKSEAICEWGHCDVTLDARLRVAACEKTKAGKATEKMWHWIMGKKKKLEIGNAEPNMQTEMQVD